MSSSIFLQIVTLGLMGLSSTLALGPAAVNLGAAGTFAIIGNSGVSTVPPSVITGNIGLSPASSSALTGFSFTKSLTGTSASSTQVVGSLFAADFSTPTPANLIAANGALTTAFNDAFGRVNPTSTGLGGGSIGGLTFTPGLYKWGTGVNIATDITLSGGPTDTWIFQVASTLTTASGTKVTLIGGALAQNIVWVVSGAATLGSTSVFNGIILGATSITLDTGATVNGRLLTKTAVTLQKAIVTAPLPSLSL